MESFFTPDFYEDWEYVSDHLVYLLVQPQHYIKHATFRGVRIESLRQDKAIRVIYTFEKFKTIEDKDIIKRKFNQALNVFVSIVEEYYLVKDHLQWFELSAIVFEENDEANNSKQEQFCFSIEDKEKTIFIAYNLDSAIEIETDDSKRKALQDLEQKILSQLKMGMRKRGCKAIIWSINPQWAYVWSIKNCQDTSDHRGILKRLGLQGIEPLLQPDEIKQFLEVDVPEDIFGITGICAMVDNNSVWLSIPLLDGGQKRLKTLIAQWEQQFRESLSIPASLRYNYSDNKT